MPLSMYSDGRGPLSVSATRNLPPKLAGAGSGVYNTTRQIGAVLGSAGIAALIEARITANFPASTGGTSAGGAEQQVGALPGFLQQPFATAMGQSLVRPAVVLVVAIVAALFLAKPKQTVAWQQTGSVATQPDAAGAPTEHVGAHAAAAAQVTAGQELAATDHHGRHAGE